MQESFHHILDTIYPNNSLLILEAMIPYVEPSLKLPLALLIKMQEIQILMQVLNNPTRMEACGLNRSNNNSEEMLNVLCQAMGMDVMRQMKQMQSMMNMMNVMNNMNSTNEHIVDIMNTEKSSFANDSQPNSAKDLEDTNRISTFSSDTRNDMIAAIRQILSKQEGTFNESESIT